MFGVGPELCVRLLVEGGLYVSSGEAVTWVNTFTIIILLHTDKTLFCYDKEH